MRAFYSTQKSIRVFILGSPEGWQVTVYDLKERRWAEICDGFHELLKDAQTDAPPESGSVAWKETGGNEVAIEYYWVTTQPGQPPPCNTNYLNEVWKEFARDDFSGVEIGFPIRMVVKS